MTLHLPADSLPRELGGNLKVDHGAWLRYCYKSMTNRAGDLCDITSGTSPLFPLSSDDRPDDDVSEAGLSSVDGDDIEGEDDDVDEEEIVEEPLPQKAIQVEVVAQRAIVSSISLYFVALAFICHAYELLLGLQSIGLCWKVTSLIQLLGLC